MDARERKVVFEWYRDNPEASITEIGVFASRRGITMKDGDRLLIFTDMVNYLAATEFGRLRQA